MQTYNRITENCFNHCIYDMNKRSLNTTEVTSISSSLEMNHVLHSWYDAISVVLILHR